MNRIADASGQSLASTDSAFGPCSAISARSVSGSMTQLSDRCARRCASSSALQAALTTRNRWLAEIRHHQVVENAAGVVGELGVALPARRNAKDVLRHQPLQRQRGVLDLAGFRPQRDLAHMRDVEQAGGAAGMQVFPEHAGGELHRHVVAGERHHLAAAGHVQRMQRGGFQCGFGRRAQASWDPRGSRGEFLENLSKPHLSLCLRVLSRRRTHPGTGPAASLSRC